MWKSSTEAYRQTKWCYSKNCNSNPHCLSKTSETSKSHKRKLLLLRKQNSSSPKIISDNSVDYKSFKYNTGVPVGLREFLSLGCKDDWSSIHLCNLETKPNYDRNNSIDIFPEEFKLVGLLNESLKIHELWKSNELFHVFAPSRFQTKEQNTRYFKTKVIQDYKTVVSHVDGGVWSCCFLKG